MKRWEADSVAKKNKILLAAVGAVILVLLVCLIAFGGGKGDAPSAETAAPSTSSGVYTVELCNDSGMPLEGIGIYVYTDATQQELVWFARTDAEGKITFRDVTCEGYIAVLDGVSTDYIVEESYPLTGEHTKIVVTAQMQSGVDLSQITRKLGDVMFDFTVTSSDGVEYTLSELLKEKDAVVLNFWYLNCDPCRQEFPYLQEAYEEYSDRIEVLAMNPVDGTDEEIAVFKKELELTFPMFACDPDWAHAMQLTAYPTTVIIDRDGFISLIHGGSITSTKIFTDAFAHFTAEDYTPGVVEDISDLETEAPGSNPEEPIELGGVQSFQATIPAGGKIYYNLYRVNGYLTASNADLYAVYNNYTYGPKAGGIGFSIKAPDTYTPAVLTLGNSGKEEITVTVYIAKLAGVVDNPYEAELDQEFTTSVGAGNDQGVYYQVTASETGYLVFECLEASEGIEYNYLMQNLQTNQQNTLEADGNAEGTMVSIKVNAEDVVKCWIVAEKDKAGNKYPGGKFKSKLYMSDTPVTEETEAVAKIDYAVTVTDESRKGVLGVYLYVYDAEGKLTATIKTDEKGVAHTQLVPGDYDVKLDLTMQGGKYKAVTTEFTLTEKRPYASIKLDTLVVEMATYTVTVVDMDGNPVKDAMVTIGSTTMTTGKDGKAVFTLPKGEYTIIIFRPDGSVQNETIQEGQTELQITPGQSGEPDEPNEPEQKLTYTVKVVDYSGTPQSGVTVQFLSGKNAVAVQTTDGTGQVSASLEPGNYTVSLAFSGSRMYYEAAKAVLSSSRPVLTLRVTNVTGGKPADEWFGPTYTVNLGGTYVEMQPNVVTYFGFTPEQEGTYRITASNPDATISYWGSINYPIQQEINGGVASNTFELNVKESNIGGTYAIGVTGVRNSILEIERIGSAVLDDTDMPWEIYQGSRPTKAYSAGSGKKFTYVNLTGKTSDFTPVLGSDGYYHLNSATGKLLYVNLGPNAPYISMYNMLGFTGFGGTRLGQYFYDSNGNLLRKEDYTECMSAYVECIDPNYGVYPLTEDLMYMLQNGGDNQNWWNADNENNFLFADLGAAFNEELGWMFAVCY